MWDIYDLVYYVCQFATQRDEASILSVTKYINDSVLRLGYGFSTKTYYTSLPICSKIVSLIHHVVLNTEKLPREIMWNLRSVEHSYAAELWSLNIGILPNLIRVGCGKIITMPPLRNTCQKLSISNSSRPLKLSLPACLRELVLYDCAFEDDVCVIPYGVESIDLYLLSDIHITIPSSVKIVMLSCREELGGIYVFPDTVEILGIYNVKFIPPPRLKKLVVHSALEITDANFFPQTLEEISISGGTNVDQGVIWPSRLKSLSACSSAYVCIDKLPDSLERLSYWTDIHRLFPKLIALSAKSTTKVPATLKELELGAGGISPDVFYALKLDKLRIFTVEDIIVPCLSPADRPRAFPEVRNISCTNVTFPDNSVVLHDITTKIELNNCQLYRVIPNRILKKFELPDNFLTSIDDLPDSVEYIDVGSNKITSIGRLPKSLITLIISRNPLQHMVPLPRLVQKVVMHGINKLKSITLSERIRKVDVKNSSITTLFITGNRPDKIKGRVNMIPVTKDEKK